MIKNRLVYL